MLSLDSEPLTMVIFTLSASVDHRTVYEVSISRSVGRLPSNETSALATDDNKVVVPAMRSSRRAASNHLVRYMVVCVLFQSSSRSVALIGAQSSSHSKPPSPSTRTQKKHRSEFKSQWQANRVIAVDSR